MACHRFLPWLAEIQVLRGIKGSGRGWQGPLLLSLGAVFAITGPVAPNAGAQGIYAEGAVEFDTEVAFEWGYGLDSADAQKLDARVESEIEVNLPAGIRFTGSGRWRGDAFDRMWEGDTRSVEVSSISRPRLIGNKMEVELREFFFEGRSERAHWRVGKQQVVWGQADGLKVLDVINPQDFRGFILDDFEDSRIPLWTVNVEVPTGPVSTQLLWIPDASGHAFAPQGSVFAFQAKGLAYPRAQPGLDVVVQEIERPTRFVSDSDAGLRLTSMWGGWDLSLNYLYHHEDVPVPFRKTDLTGPTPTLRFQPKYERSHLAGGTFSNAWGHLTVRGEAGFSAGRYYPADALSDADGVVRSDEFSYVVGLDWYRFEEVVLSAQVFHSWATRNTDAMIRHEHESVATLLVQRDFLNDSLILENMWLYDLRNHDGLVRPKIKYEISTGLHVYAGIDLFYGKRDGLFGQFAKRDRLLLGFEYGF